MNCIESLKLLSEYYDQTLGENVREEITFHLSDCPPCHGLYRDLQLIIEAANILREKFEVVSYPDENIIWRRIEVTRIATGGR